MIFTSRKRRKAIKERRIAAARAARATSVPKPRVQPTRAAEPVEPAPQRTRKTARLVLAVMLIMASLSVVVLSPLGALITGSDADKVATDAAQAAEVVAACNAKAPAPAKQISFKKAPPSRLDSGKDYWASIYTSCGDFKIDLLERNAPIAVNNFVFLAKQGFFNGLRWHQVSHDFLIQTGDPNGQNGVAPDDAGYTIKDELPSSANAYKYGTVGFANRAEANTAGSQFFVVVHDLAGALEGKGAALQIEPTYTAFGRIPKKFFGSVENIARQPVHGGTDPLTASQPVTPVFIEGIEIHAK